MSGLRIFLTGVGGQGTLTATRLLAQTAMEQGIEVISGEIHGMAQRGGVVESTVLLGGYGSPRITYGEADVLLGFEPLETLRALPYLKKGGTVFSSTEAIFPLGVSMGRDTYPEIGLIVSKTSEIASKSRFLPLLSLGRQAGAVQSGNVALLGALCASGQLPFGLDALFESIKRNLPPKIVASNVKAAELGADFRE